ncbi:MAG: DUF177 domain-containing protein [Burkholderiales bacterium]|nr:DUF177 domain-containing protein [Burkholderiales bacterium]
MQHITSTGRSFDAFRLARERGVLEGTLDVAVAPRLADRLADGVTGIDPLCWRIAGTRDAAGRPALAIAIAGRVPVTCQRCLAPLVVAVDRQTVTLLAKSEQDADALDAGSADEVLVADHALVPSELVEDELLLTLPFAPTHEPGACVAGKA